MRAHDTTNTTLKILSVVAQLGGIGFLLIGVDVVRSWLVRAADTSVTAGYGLRRWWTLRSAALRRRYAHLRGRPISTTRSASDSIGISDSATVSMSYHRVDREIISDRDWLAHLDDRVAGLLTMSTDAEKRRAEDRREWECRHQSQRDEFRAELLRATRRGWQFIAAGLALSAVGIVLGAVA